MDDVMPVPVDTPLGTPEEFHQLLLELATDYAPRRFAICEEHGDRIDGRVFAWGMAFEDHAWLCADDSSLVGKFATAENAVRVLSRGGRRLHLSWIDAISAGYRTDSD
ncbi:hypothetical protein [Micromonospora sp. NBC_01796]|uniref:hypothetical protein n=1 Tax=Micromonospora sp. NBC_01796 TaxID=2975987 RepID=UPI002DD8EDB9|nr:hypothetical protein [Micromonospora sp. NBC_01796]WSA83331.1 hypothetical protein OIE47_23320 [Micromonospora sp. NBC_01796]